MKRRSLLFFISATALIVAWFFLLYAPTATSVEQLEQKAQAAENKAIQIKREISTLPNILKAQQQAVDEQEQLTVDLFARNEIMSLLSKVDQKCQLHHLATIEVRPPVEELVALNNLSVNNESPQFLNLTLVLSGSYQGFGKFIALLEKAPYFRGINSSRIIASTDGTTATQYVIDFKVLLGRIGETGG